MDDFLSPFRRWSDIEGRSRRREFWMFHLLQLVAVLALLLVTHPLPEMVGLLVVCAYVAVGFFPGVALQIRRLHDTDRSGWWMLIGLVPYLGAVALFVLNCLDGTRGENRYGPDPKFMGA